MKKLLTSIILICAMAICFVPFATAEEELSSGKYESGLVGTSDYPWRQVHTKQLFLYYTDAIVNEGDTADAYETTVTFTEPTADRTITIPNASGTVALSAGAEGAANAVWFGNNTVVFEGATANASEATIQATDPTADVVFVLPVAAAASYAIMMSSLATNAPDIVNSVTGGTNELIFEGTADAHEIHLTAADATADVLYTLPDAAAATYGIMPSTLATNAPDIANSVTGGTNQLIFEGTADAFETSVTPDDPTVDRTITLPDYSGAIPIVVSQDSTQTSANNTTSDVTGSSLTLADGWFGAGKTLKWTMYGTCTGANAVKNIILYIDDGAIVTLATQAADVGDWKAEFILHEHTAYATQDAMGVALMNQEGIITDYATDTTDFNDGGTTTVKCQIQSTNGGDTITVEYIVVEMWDS